MDHFFLHDPNSVGESVEMPRVLESDYGHALITCPLADKRDQGVGREPLSRVNSADYRDTPKRVVRLEEGAKKGARFMVVNVGGSPERPKNRR